VRAGYVVCHLSTRNSAPAIAHLLEKVGAKHLLISAEPSIRFVALEALEQIGQDRDTFISNMPSYSDIINDQPVRLLPKRNFSPDGKFLYLHSSGKLFCISHHKSFGTYFGTLYRLHGFPKAICMDPRELVKQRQGHA
jgi:hypothetical protein